MGRKNSKNQQYDIKNLQILAKKLFDIRNNLDNGKTLFRVNIENLEKAIKNLPVKDRENIEKFWGLTGGPNHSKKLIVRHNDYAYHNMQKAAEISMIKLFEIDRVFIYDENLKKMSEFLSKKIVQKETQISVIEAIKYLIAFFGILENGPKMAFEEDPLIVDKSFKEDLVFDEYAVIYGIYQEFQKYPDNCIKLRILINWLEWMDLEDANIIKKTFGIPLPNIDHLKEAEKLLQKLPQFEGKEIYPTSEQLDEVKAISKLSNVRAFKERIFPYGCWDVTSSLIFEETPESELKEFFEKMNMIKGDCTKINQFKSGEMQIRTSAGIRNLDIFEIGGLKFTDPDEIRFLYTERNYFSV